VTQCLPRLFCTEETESQFLGGNTACDSMFCLKGTQVISLSTSEVSAAIAPESGKANSISRRSSLPNRPVDDGSNWHCTLGG
jgi:hypothetical protein